ncbi:hypothetical protein BD413DRAFT_310526 [Trametes elegans]|nr:hypothetical protein BD413DRAFT_310526 [Trametes elegans]
MVPSSTTRCCSMHRHITLAYQNFGRRTHLLSRTLREDRHLGALIASYRARTKRTARGQHLPHTRARYAALANLDRLARACPRIFANGIGRPVGYRRFAPVPGAGDVRHDPRPRTYGPPTGPTLRVPLGTSPTSRCPVEVVRRSRRSRRSS